jgi:glycosyltransferase involved in cell wall biosynthesis
MKIGINARAFSDPEPDGAVQTAIELTRRLVAREEFDVVVYGHPSVSRYFEPDVAVESAGCVTGSQFFGVAWERTALPLLALRDDLDVLLCPNGNAPPFPVPGCTVLMYIHDVNAMKGMSSGIHRLYRRSMVPIGARFADRVLTVSEFSKSEICDVLSIPPEKVRVVYNGVDEHYFDEDPGERLDLPDQYILYVGAMNPRKNVGLLIDTYEELRRKEGIPHKLVLVGPENKRVYKNFEVERSDDVLVTGFVSEAQLKYAYRNASLFVYPSSYEGFGLPPLEAMACGTPTIASNRSSLPEVLDSAALLFDPDERGDLYEKMYLGLTDEPTRTSLRTEGRRRARKFTWDRALRQLVSEFDPQ